MKRAMALLLVTLCFTLGGMKTARAEHIGPLKSPLNQGQALLGVGYAYDSTKWNKPVNDDATQNDFFAKLGIGFGGGWELGVSGGMTNLSVDRGFSSTDKAFDGRYRPVAGLSLGGPLFSGRTLSIGPFVSGRYSYLFTDDILGTAYTSSGGTVIGAEKISIKNLWTATAGLKFQLEIEDASLYFGPSYTLGGGEYRDAFVSAAGSYYVQEDVEPATNFGAFAGIRWPLPSNWPTESNRTYLDLEGRYRDNLSGSLALNVSF